jgi:TPR repeat protein
MGCRIVLKPLIVIVVALTTMGASPPSAKFYSEFLAAIPADVREAYARDDWSYVLQRMKQRAEFGDPNAQTVLGLLNYFGYGTPQNFAEAVRWLGLASERGSTIAQANLADIYAEGQGVAVDRTKAAELWKRASQKGHTLAKANLGAYYFRAEGGYPNKCKAYEIWREAAALGGGAALHHLSMMFLTGDGIKQNKVKAHMLATLAARHMEPGRSLEKKKAAQLSAEIEQRFARFSAFSWFKNYMNQRPCLSL